MFASVTGTLTVVFTPNNYIMKILYVLAFVFLFGQFAMAQASYPSLDAKNGFRDAKFGMTLSSFKGKMIDDESTKSSNEDSGDYKKYIRSGDSKHIEDIEIERIEYEFYLNILSEIHIYLQTKKQIYLLDALMQVYGKPYEVPPGYTALGPRQEGQRIFIWNAKNVKQTLWFGIFDAYGIKGANSYAALHIESKYISSKIQSQMTRKRAADL